MRVFLTLPTKSILEKFNLQKTSSEKAFHKCAKKFFLKFESIQIRNTGVMDYSKKKTLGGHVLRRISTTCQSARMTRRRDESDVIFCFSYSAPDVKRGHQAFFFLKIHDFRISHLNNFKIHESSLMSICKNWQLVFWRDR